MRAGVQASHLRDHPRRQTGSSVHRNVKGDEVGSAKYLFIETLHGEVQCLHEGTPLPQHCGWLG